MKTHLIAITGIIREFKRKYKFIDYYLNIEGQVAYDMHARLNVQCNSEFDKFTRLEIKKIQSDLYEQIRSYLEENDIKQIVYIESSTGKFAETVVYFKESMSC